MSPFVAKFEKRLRLGKWMDVDLSEVVDLYNKLMVYGVWLEDHRASRKSL